MDVAAVVAAATVAVAVAATVAVAAVAATVTLLSWLCLAVLRYLFKHIDMIAPVAGVSVSQFVERKHPDADGTCTP